MIAREKFQVNLSILKVLSDEASFFEVRGRLDDKRFLGQKTEQCEKNFQLLNFVRSIWFGCRQKILGCFRLC